jgi:hypothetical protein
LPFLFSFANKKKKICGIPVEREREVFVHRKDWKERGIQVCERE